MTLRLSPLLIVLLAFAACDEPADPAVDDATGPTEQAAEVDDPQSAWWDNMRVHCDQAYAGSLTEEPEGDDMLEGEELLVVHFRECSDQQLRLPFHIEQMDGEWDRSRTWIFTRHEDSIELRHDHRQEDGSPDETTDYGGFTHTLGTANEQVFLFTEYDEYDPEGPQRGWRVQIEPHTSYTYGTFRQEEGEWRWRVDFDLSETIEPPPAPWGHE